MRQRCKALSGADQTACRIFDGPLMGLKGQELARALETYEKIRDRYRPGKKPS